MRAKVEIINDEVKTRNFEDIAVGTVFESEGHIFLKTGIQAVLLTDNDFLGTLVSFDDDDFVTVYDQAVITVRTRAK